MERIETDNQSPPARYPGVPVFRHLRKVLSNLTLLRPDRGTSITENAHPILTGRIRKLSRWIEIAGEMTRANRREEIRSLFVKFLCEEMDIASVRFVPRGIEGSLLGSMSLELLTSQEVAELRMQEGMEWGRAEWALARRSADFTDAMLSTLGRLEDAERQSLTDPLTQLYNRRSLDRLLEREVLMAARYHQALSVVVMDIDRFKEVNDTLGHEAGDQLLRQVAGVMTSTLRRSDLAFRVGGDEFVVLLPQTTLANAMAAIEKVRRGVADAVRQAEVPARLTTLSIGVAELWPGATAMQVLRAADEAMYQAKRENRDCVRAYRQAA